MRLGGKGLQLFAGELGAGHGEEFGLDRCLFGEVGVTERTGRRGLCGGPGRIWLGYEGEKRKTIGDLRISIERSPLARDFNAVGMVRRRMRKPPPYFNPAYTNKTGVFLGAERHSENESINATPEEAVAYGPVAGRCAGYP